MDGDKISLDDITYKINGCAMKVHRTLGNGFQEVIYQRCLAIELERVGLSFVREQEHAVFYEDIQVGTRRADFVVEDSVVVELRACLGLATSENQRFMNLASHLNTHLTRQARI